MGSSPTVDLRCPACNRFLCEVTGFGRAVCRDCGWEITVKSKAERALARSKEV